MPSANHVWDKVETFGKGYVEFYGRFDISTGAITGGSIVPATTIFAVTKPAGTGLYRVTFTESYFSFLYADANIIAAAGTLNGDIQPVAFNANSSGKAVIDFQTRQTSDGTAIDTLTGTVCFQIVMKYIGVQP